MKWKEQTLVLLLTESGDVSEADLLRWLEHPRLADLRKDVLKSLHAKRLVEYDAAAGMVRLLPPGVTEAEKLVAPAA